MKDLKVLVFSGRTLRQGVGKEAGKNSERYKSSVSICEMNSKDIESLSIKSGDNVRITTEFGSIVLKSAASLYLNNSGMIYIPYGPYASFLFGSETGSSGMPTFKGVPAILESAIDEPVKDITELANTLR
jgi:formylmethanofuran dehydrogenase subunit D